MTATVAAPTRGGSLLVQRSLTARGIEVLFAAEVTHRHRNPRDDAALLALHPGRPG
ncbi:hypothetical protein QRX60_33865 [Amycolatopsis mongoliensis]|uniref:Uncharacterized protein n=1 Tax=Amycolatopsis mongoliensis TaxID=715475 RepID=A0A9Y2JKK1_9PSEU|nr:hypothetical protein [Amycolatopsis sp. 4-36]WIX99018.1 hypothetical protein QRX60_33865 [Amycolatopsis sp. 4-36]